VLPSLRLEWAARPVSRKVDRLSYVRFGSARYSVPCRLIGHRVTITTADQLIYDHRADHWGGVGRAPDWSRGVRSASSTPTTTVRSQTGPDEHPGPEPRRRRASWLSDRSRKHSWLGGLGRGVEAVERTSRHRHPACRSRHRRLAGRAALGCGVPPLAGRRRPLHPCCERRCADPAPGAGMGSSSPRACSALVGQMRGYYSR
jgi:hypothetical protein